ncbi:hypothetical protein [Amaricoccus sp. W119]|uniref:hypothetical protein n=1 Tax=Amaricoccus sp. W119 TaxID=3391833 RepID=UPI0039A783F7
MFSRRVFIQGTAAVFGALLPSIAASSEQAASQTTIAIDSVETPRFDAAGYQRHIRLSGGQLDRFNRLKRLFDETSEIRLDIHLDDTGRVLLETALNASGKHVTLGGDAGPMRFRPA